MTRRIDIAALRCSVQTWWQPCLSGATAADMTDFHGTVPKVLAWRVLRRYRYSGRCVNEHWTAALNGWRAATVRTALLTLLSHPTLQQNMATPFAGMSRTLMYVYSAANIFS